MAKQRLLFSCAGSGAQGLKLARQILYQRGSKDCTPYPGCVCQKGQAWTLVIPEPIDKSELQGGEKMLIRTVTAGSWGKLACTYSSPVAMPKPGYSLATESVCTMENRILFPEGAKLGSEPPAF